MRTAPLSRLAALLCLSGCHSYTNVPPIDGDTATNDANSVAVREIESAAVRALLEDQPVDGPYVVELPEGTTTLTYEVVIPTIGPNARIPGPDDGVEPVATFDVRAIRIRGLQAEVDIQRVDTALGGPGQLFTVHMQHDSMEGWYGKRIKRWGMIRDRSLQAPTAP